VSFGKEIGDGRILKIKFIIMYLFAKFGLEFIIFKNNIV
jgi:hypothetical protein